MSRIRLFCCALLLSVSLCLPALTQEETPATPESVAATEATAEPPSAAAPSPAEDAPGNEFERWVGRLRDAGATIPVLILLSVFAVAVIIERSVRLRRKNIAPMDLAAQVRPLYEQREYDKLSTLCEASNSTLGRAIAFMVAHRHWPAGELSQGAGDVAARELRRHLLRSYPLAIIGALAPLLGLLGTVSGMVDAFDAVAVAGLGNVQVLGTSISKALVTTMVGLVVAIPALFAYHIFKVRTQMYGLALEELGAELMNEWFMAPEDADEAEDDDAS